MNRISRFGREIRKLRNSLGYSQEKLADLCGMDRTYIGGIERGERNVSLDNIFKIAETLGVSPAKLFEGIDAEENK